MFCVREETERKRLHLQVTSAVGYQGNKRQQLLPPPLGGARAEAELPAARAIILAWFLPGFLWEWTHIREQTFPDLPHKHGEHRETLKKLVQTPPKLSRSVINDKRDQR